MARRNGDDGEAANEEVTAVVGELAHRRTREIVESIADAFYALDDNLRFTYANARALELWGKRAEEVMGRRFLDVLPEAAGSDAYKAHETAAAERRVVHLETFSPILDRWIEVGIHPAENGLTVCLRDVSERKRAEAHLRESEARLRLILESATDYAIITTDSKGAFTGWNVGACNLFGWEEAEVLGRYAGLIFTPEDRAAGADQAEMRKALDEGRAADERWHLRKDGSRFWGAGLLMPMREPAPEGFLKILRDRTQERQAEATLLESEERFRSFAENSADTLWIVNAETVQLEYLNPAYERMWGEPRDAVMGDLARWAERVRPEDRERAMAGLPHLLKGETVVVDYRIVRPDDAIYWIRDTGFPIRDRNGVVRRVAGIAREITEEKRAEERRNVLVAELQHRTRNLLAVVRSIASQTLAASSSFEAFGREFDGRLAALGRVQGLISRATREPADLGDIVRAELAAHGARADGTRVTLDGPAVALPARTVQPIALALHELATNALKHGALAVPAGRLEVRWRVTPPDGAARRLVVEWLESGVAMKERPPTRRGYGRELIENALPYDLEAAIQLDFGREGVRCRIELPLAGGADAGGAQKS